MRCVSLELWAGLAWGRRDRGIHHLVRRRWGGSYTLCLSSKGLLQPVLVFYTHAMADAELTQPEFHFNEEGPDGYSAWVNRRRAAMEQLARQVGLPIGHRVEVWLRGEVRLCGLLRLHHESLFPEDHATRDLQLEVDGVPFSAGEIETCVRLD